MFSSTTLRTADLTTVPDFHWG